MRINKPLLKNLLANNLPFVATFNDYVSWISNYERNFISSQSGDKNKQINYQQNYAQFTPLELTPVYVKKHFIINDIALFLYVNNDVQVANTSFAILPSVFTINDLVSNHHLEYMIGIFINDEQFKYNHRSLQKFMKKCQTALQRPTFRYYLQKLGNDEALITKYMQLVLSKRSLTSYKKCYHIVIEAANPTAEKQHLQFAKKLNQRFNKTKKEPAAETEQFSSSDSTPWLTDDEQLVPAELFSNQKPNRDVDSPLGATFPAQLVVSEVAQNNSAMNFQDESLIAPSVIDADAKNSVLDEGSLAASYYKTGVLGIDEELNNKNLESKKSLFKFWFNQLFKTNKIQIGVWITFVSLFVLTLIIGLVLIGSANFDGTNGFLILSSHINISDILTTTGLSQFLNNLKGIGLYSQGELLLSGLIISVVFVPILFALSAFMTLVIIFEVKARINKSLKLLDEKYNPTTPIATVLTTNK